MGEVSLAAEKELERIMEELQAESQRNMDDKLKTNEDDNTAFAAKHDIEERGHQGHKHQEDDQKEPKVDGATIPTDVADEVSTINISRVVANTKRTSSKKSLDKINSST